MTIAIMCWNCEKTIFLPPQRIYDGGICWSCDKKRKSNKGKKITNKSKLIKE